MMIFNLDKLNLFLDLYPAAFTGNDIRDSQREDIAAAETPVDPDRSSNIVITIPAFKEVQQGKYVLLFPDRLNRLHVSMPP